MIKLEKTILVGRYNLIDTSQHGDEKYIRQLSLKEVKSLLKSAKKILLYDSKVK